MISTSALDAGRATVFRRRSTFQHLAAAWSSVDQAQLQKNLLLSSAALGVLTFTDALPQATYAALFAVAVALSRRHAAARGGRKARLRSRSNFSLLSSLPSDVVRVCCAGGYLDARELLRCGEASRALSRVCLYEHAPWDDLLLSLRGAAARAVALDGAWPPPSSEEPRRAFFDEASRIAERLCGAAPPGRCMLSINDRALDVTAFVDQHPGGGELLLEFRGKDASHAYNSYPHTFYARDLLDRFVVFDPAPWVGRRRPGALGRRASNDDATAASHRDTLVKFGVSTARLRRRPPPR